MKKKNEFKKLKGNNKVYKGIKIDIDPLTNARIVKEKNIKPINNFILHKEIKEKIKGE